MSDKHKDIEHWSRIATEWMAWARAPNHDAFWAYRGQGSPLSLAEGKVAANLIGTLDDLIVAASDNLMRPGVFQIVLRL